ncbi:hypothetical protein LTR64_005714 [Lithohypha guttulata]|uniref:uncharacterized protein n=1 Tax=Lithohypha guttulata TaxID=1690604 RepID=UPI002DDF52BD|nr:hypothetical protein LTR51_002491 [Lithohypha guttulata]
MADSAVTERRIRPIIDALSAGNVKQALKDCEKWQKKGEASDRFLALKAAVLLRSPDKKQKESGSKETLQLCRRTEPVLNFEAIHQLQDSLKLMHLDGEESPKLWERAVAARPNDHELVTTWLNSSITASNWQNAQKATMALRKAFPKERKYDYWNILMCYLISQDGTSQEKDRKLFGTLASRMVTKAAQDKSDKGISSIEELSLLAAIMMTEGSAAELVDLLNSEQLRLVTSQDRLATESLLLPAVSQADSDQLYRTFIGPRVSVGNKNVTEDDRFWSIVVRAAKTPRLMNSQLTLLETILSREPNHRQALLASIDLLASITLEDKAKASELLEASRRYYELFGAKAFCFDDLISKLMRPGIEVVRTFSTMIDDSFSTEINFVQKLFSLKLRFNLLCQEDLSESRALDFGSKALNLYKSSGDDNPLVSAESALLAALVLLRLASGSNRRDYVMQASIILQSACQHYKDYYPLRMLLVQVQMFSGQIHLAMGNFIHLSIKNLQWETLGHFILTRISTLHPRQYGHGADSLNPLGALDTALTVFSNSQRSLDRAIRDGLKHESYSNVINTVDLRNSLQNSVVKQCYEIEERKCQRMLSVPVASDLELHEGELVDLRDTSFMPGYGVEDTQLQTYLQCGPQPFREWIDAMALHEYLTDFLSAEAMDSRSDIEAAQKHLAKVMTRTSNTTDCLTKDERAALELYKDLSNILLQFSSKENSGSPNLQNLLAKLKDDQWSIHPTTVNGVEYPDWHYLHHHFVNLELLRTTAQFTNIVAKKLKADKDKTRYTELKKNLDELKPVLKELVEATQQRAKDLKQELSASGVLGRLVDVTLCRTDETDEASKVFAERMAELQDEAAVEEYCGMMRDSWEDALDGILAVKIKLT